MNDAGDGKIYNIHKAEAISVDKTDGSEEDLQSHLDNLSSDAPSVTSDDITDATATGKSVLTADDAAAARAATGAGTSSFSGAYSDLSGKPTIPTVPVADHVADADGTDTTTLAASVDALRDALVQAGLMASA